MNMGPFRLSSMVIWRQDRTAVSHCRHRECVGIVLYYVVSNRSFDVVVSQCPHNVMVIFFESNGMLQHGWNA